MKYFNVVLIILVCLLTSGRPKQPAERILFDFETDEELDLFHWKCHTLFVLSDDHVTHGTKSLKLELFPSDYPGLTLKIKNTNWSQYRALRFHVHNPQSEDISLSVRIDDRKDYPDYADRYSKRFIVKSGKNTIGIPFESFATAGTNRLLDLRMIYRVFIFMVQPREKTVLYFDDIRLVR